MAERPKFSDILRNGATESLRSAWANTQAASEYAPLPRGEYIALVVGGDPHVAKTGTTGYKLTFRVCEGDCAGRRFWLDLWFTPDAFPGTKRDLAKLGVTADSFDELVQKLDRPLPPGIKVKANLALLVEDDGRERNKVLMFKVIGVEKDPFVATTETAQK